ncbi:MAG: hypothetical protein WBQ94_27275 [Terracidiphilus sp.]
MDWFKKQWSTVVTLGCIIIAALIEAWQQAAGSVSANIPLPRLQGDWHYVPLILLAVAGVVWLLGRGKKPPQLQLQTSGVTPGIPTLSALLGQNPNVEFNARQFFALAHYSPITAEVEKNIKIIAQQNSPNEKEAFYARFIGVGAVAYQHDVTWFTIFGSQLTALTELNSRGLIPIADLKKHYDNAVAHFPKTYENYSFEQWMDYMQSRMLIAKYPSQMVELSFNGKDFLKYLAHVGRSVSGKTN